MGIMDDKLVMCDSTTVGTGTTAAKIGDDLDLGLGYDAHGNSKTPDIGNSGKIFLNVICEDVDFASAGTPTDATIYLRTADNAAGTSNPVNLITKVLPMQHETKNGDVIFQGAIPAGQVKRYLMIFFGTTVAMTAGSISAWLSLEAPTELSLKK